MDQLVLILIIALISFIHWLFQQSAELKKKRRAAREAEGGGELLQRPSVEEPDAPPARAPSESMRELMEALGLPMESDPPPLPRAEARPPIVEVVTLPPVPEFQAPAPRPEAKKPPAMRQSARFEEQTRTREAASVPSLRRLLAAPSGLRDAVVLSEILGPPVSLRPPASLRV